MKNHKSKVSDKSWRHKPTGFVPDAELAVEQDQFELTRLDWFVAPLAAALAAVWAFPYIGTATNWDDLFYMNLSQYTTPQGWVLNRYGHIYLQKFFFWLAGDALTGTRIYWCFLFFATCVLVYWCARMLARHSGYIVGLIAVLLFCIPEVFARYVGCTLADFSVMFFVALGTFVYLSFLAGKYQNRHFIIMILGLIFFWTLKSKEIGLCFAVLFLGLGEESTGTRNIGRFIKDIGWLCLGMIAACVLLMLLDLIFMGDIFFAIRPDNWHELFAHNFMEFKTSWPIMTWYTYLATQPLLPLCLLYLLIGWKMNRQSSSKDRMIVWLVPLAMLFLIQIIAVLRGHYHVDSRYFAGAIPGICIWAAQFFQFRLSGSLYLRKNKHPIPRAPVVLILILVAFIIVCAFMPKTADIAQNTRVKTSERFYAAVIMPLSTTVLLIVGAISKKRGLFALFISSLCLFFLIYSPLKSNLTSLKQRTVAKKSEWRYEPYRVFADELRLAKDVKILVSKDVHKRSWMLGRRRDAHCWMFNVFFNQKFDYDSFIDGSREDILKGNYTYAFLTWRDWKDLTEKHDVEHLTKNYAVNSNKALQLILLKKR